MGWRVFGSDEDGEVEFREDGLVGIDWIVIVLISERFFGGESGKVGGVRGLKIGEEEGNLGKNRRKDWEIDMLTRRLRCGGGIEGCQ